MMSRVFSEWRSTHSHNHGGLVWFYKDLWPGAGWGVIDALGQPKAAYYALRRSWQNRQVTITDEGLNGLHLHLLNETSVPVAGTLAISLWKEPRTLVAQQKIQVEIAARGQQQFSADEILGSFYDVNYAYRFGPPHHDVVVATWTDATGQILSEAHYTIQRRDPGFASGVTLTATAVAQEDGTCLVTLDSDTYLHGVALHAKGYLPDDNHFSLSPGRAKQVRFRSRSAHTVPFKADITALNYTGEIRVLPTA